MEDEFTSLPGDSMESDEGAKSSLNLSKALTKAAGASVSSSIPIRRVNQNAMFTVGTPPPASSLRSTASSSFGTQMYYSPMKSANLSFSPGHMSTGGFSFQDTHTQSLKSLPITMPLPSPSLSYNFKDSHQNLTALKPSSSSAESMISDMVKEAMDPMMQSVYVPKTGPQSNSLLESISDKNLIKETPFDDDDSIINMLQRKHGQQDDEKNGKSKNNRMKIFNTKVLGALYEFVKNKDLTKEF